MPPLEDDKGRGIDIPKNKDRNTQTYKKEDFVMEYTPNQEDATRARRHTSPRCTHALKQVDNSPKTVEEFIKLKVDEAMSCMMKKNYWLVKGRQERSSLRNCLSKIGYGPLELKMNIFLMTQRKRIPRIDLEDIRGKRMNT